MLNNSRCILSIQKLSGYFCHVLFSQKSEDTKIKVLQPDSPLCSLQRIQFFFLLSAGWEGGKFLFCSLSHRRNLESPSVIFPISMTNGQTSFSQFSTSVLLFPRSWIIYISSIFQTPKESSTCTDFSEDQLVCGDPLQMLPWILQS